MPSVLLDEDGAQQEFPTLLGSDIGRAPAPGRHSFTVHPDELILLRRTCSRDVLKGEGSFNPEQRFLGDGLALQDLLEILERARIVGLPKPEDRLFPNLRISICLGHMQQLGHGFILR